jgi:cytochrome c oxidase assembly factor CtaG
MSATTGIADQHRGGAIMWAMGMLIDAIWISMAAYDWIENEKKIASAND